MVPSENENAVFGAVDRNTCHITNATYPITLFACLSDHCIVRSRRGKKRQGELTAKVYVRMRVQAAVWFGSN